MNEFPKQIKSQLGDQLWRQLRDGILHQLRANYDDDLLEDDLQLKLNDQFGSQLRYQLRELGEGQ